MKLSNLFLKIKTQKLADVTIKLFGNRNEFSVFRYISYLSGYTRFWSSVEFAHFSLGGTSVTPGKGIALLFIKKYKISNLPGVNVRLGPSPEFYSLVATLPPFFLLISRCSVRKFVSKRCHKSVKKHIKNMSTKTETLILRWLLSIKLMIMLS